MLKEWMRDHDLDKIFWRIVCVLILMFAFNIKVVNLSSDQAKNVLDYKREHYTKELNEYELNDFIKLYPKFKSEEIFKNKDIDAIAENPEDADWITKRWFNYQTWDIQRFFYVKNRCVEALEIIKKQKTASGFISQLENRVKQNLKTAENEKNKKENLEEKYDIAKQVLDIHKKQAEDNGDFTAEELQLVAKKAEELEKILN